MNLQLSTILKIKNKPCGINLFDKTLRKYLLKRGIISSCFDIDNIKPSDNGIFLFHYVPSMYVGQTENISNFFLKTKALKLVIIHGAYPNQPFEYLSDTKSPDVQTQLDIISKHSDIIICLSNSTTEILKSWEPTVSKTIETLYHPGLDHTYLITKNTEEQYVFIGGITRPKKDFNSTKHIQLINELAYSGIKVWLHSTIPISINSSLLKVWKYTNNELDRDKWSKTISNASWVLCPYNTKIQTVSGIISESISVGTIVLSTSFPYSLEISKTYLNSIVISDDLNKWSEIILTTNNKITAPNYPDWNTFTFDLLRIIANKI